MTAAKLYRKVFKDYENTLKKNTPTNTEFKLNYQKRDRRQQMRSTKCVRACEDKFWAQTCPCEEEDAGPKITVVIGSVHLSSSTSPSWLKGALFPHWIRVGRSVFHEKEQTVLHFL